MEHPIFCFDAFELVDDPKGGLLRFNGTPVRVPRTSLLLLQVLVRNYGRALNNDELFKAGWPEESNLGNEVVRKRVNQHILKVRDLLADCSGLDAKRVIVTENQRGYVFALKVELRQRELDAKSAGRNSDPGSEPQRTSSMPPNGLRIQSSSFASLMLTHSSQYLSKLKFTRTSFEECLANLLSFWIEYVDHAPTTVSYVTLSLPRCQHAEPVTVYPNCSDQNGIYETYLMLNRHARQQLEQRDGKMPWNSLLEDVKPLSLGDRFVVVLRREPRPKRFRVDALDILGPTIYLHNVAEMYQSVQGKYFQLTSSFAELYESIDIVGPGQWDVRYHAALHLLRLPKKGEELCTTSSASVDNLAGYLDNQAPDARFKSVAARAFQDGLALLAVNNLLTAESEERASFYSLVRMPRLNAAAGITLFAAIPADRVERSALLEDAATLANAYQLLLFQIGQCQFCLERA